MNDWVVTIPSYKRAALLPSRTLATLTAGGVEPERIHIFVADEDERAAYEKALDPKTYKALIVGVPGIGAQRNFITNYFPNGTPIVQSDDDVDGVFASPQKSSNDFSRCSDVRGLCNDAFEACARTRARLWGLYPLFNPFFMGGGVSLDLRAVIGTLHGFINDRRYVLRCAVKEDVERTIRYWLDDRAVVRFNDIAPKNRARTEPGGLQTGGRTHAVSQEAADYLLKTYPNLVKVAASRKGGHAEVTLNRFAR